ncbi:MAG: ABC transporter ATP-binding protein [Reyranellaceae bacterium]
MLRVSEIQAGYQSLVAVHDVSLELEEGEAVALIGSNGAGKTTTLRAIAGLIPISRGTIEFMGKRIDRMEFSKIAELGLVHIPEGRELFPTMTVRENLELGAQTREARAKSKANLDRAFELFPVLKERERQAAGTLSGGERQMCAIGRGLMACPQLLMLDEPSLGLAPVMVERIMGDLTRIKENGLTILLVEQHVSRALELAQKGYVIENGRITLSGDSASLISNPRVQEAYLGM